MFRKGFIVSRSSRSAHVPLQLRSLVRDIVEIASETFPRNIRIETESPEDLWPVIGDAEQIHQVLVNLTLNARDAMPEGGKLTLAAENVELEDRFALPPTEASPSRHIYLTMPSESMSGRHVRLKVTDTGAGIAEENLTRIFEPYFSTKKNGLGLGLHLVQRIVQGHGGFVRVQSEAGRGTCFEVFLPTVPTTVRGSIAAMRRSTLATKWR